MILAFATGASGTGALKLWPLFGATNQTLAALALIIITLYLKRRGGVKWVISGIPAAFMAIMTIWALVLNQVKFGAGGNILLTVINICILIIALWIAIEGVIKFFVTEEEPAAPAAPETA
jgi:carbon starvation protein